MGLLVVDPFKFISYMFIFQEVSTVDFPIVFPKAISIN